MLARYRCRFSGWLLVYSPLGRSLFRCFECNPNRPKSERHLYILSVEMAAAIVGKVSSALSPVQMCSCRACAGIYFAHMRILSLLLLLSLPLSAQSVSSPSAHSDRSTMDHDLMEVTVNQLQELYRQHRYTVVQVVQWHLDRIARYNGIYRAVQTVNDKAALAEAAREDAESKQPGFKPGLLWGVPIVTKANTSIKGLIPPDGYRGYMIPGHELVAPRDATIVS